jgi:CheY-like chemotaxis protein
MSNSLRILVVDDEPVIASTLATILRQEGYSVTSFLDPVEALAHALVETPNLLISDILMPRMSGIDLALQIKAHCPQCKILLFSGQAATVDFLRQAQLTDSTFEILAKPIHPSDLLKAIRSQATTEPSSAAA